jgi:hypothetical protein
MYLVKCNNIYYVFYMGNILFDICSNLRYSFLTLSSTKNGLIIVTFLLHKIKILFIIITYYLRSCKITVKMIIMWCDRCMQFIGQDRNNIISHDNLVSKRIVSKKKFSLTIRIKRVAPRNNVQIVINDHCTAVFNCII